MTDGTSEDDILITDELFRRSPRQPNLEAEIQVLRSLGQKLTKPPETTLKHFAEIAKDLCQAGAAGVSLIEATPSGEEFFRWVALSGAYEQFEGNTTPRHFSACTICLERGSAQLYSHPERYFTYLQAITPLSVEELVVPLMLEERPLGTIWIVAHDEQRQFDREDARVLTSLADFLAAALSSAQARQTAEESQRLFQHMAEASPDVLYIYDLEQERNVYVSARSKQVFDRTADEIMNRVDCIVAQLVQPEDIPRVMADIEAMREISDSETYEFEYRSPHRDSYRWIHARARAFARSKDGRVRQVIGILQDMTARKQAEEALHESETRFQMLVRNMPGMVYRYSDTDTFSYVSSGCRELFELEPETILQNASSLWALIHPDDLQSLRDSLAAAIRDSRIWQWEGRAITPSGQLKWIQGISRPQKIPRETVWDGLWLDISDRKRAEEALRAQKAHLQLIIESAKEYAIFTLNLEGYITSWNSGAKRLLGYEEAEIVGQNGRIIFTPEDIAIGSPEEERHTALTQGQKENERWHVRKDGSRFWGSGLVMPLRDEDNSIQGFLKIMQDKTNQRQSEEALRQSEARLQLALNVGRMGSWDWDMRSNTVTWSEWHFTLLGFQPNEFEPSYQAWLRSVYPDDLAATEAALQRAMTEKVEYHHQYRTVWRDGSIHWTEARGEFSYDANGQPYRMIGVIVDISARKQAEQEREQLLAHEQAAREEAEAANRIKDEFLAVLSHELRSPLNPILGWSSLLRNRKLDAAKTAYALETIERNAKLQTQLIEDLLDVSRILRGKLNLNMAPVNLALTIEAALETMRLAVEAKSIQIQTTLEPNTGQVLGDSARLQQVVWNLLSNAVKFTPNGGQVKVRLERMGTHAQIQVSDTGKGIAPDFLPHVFEYFRQADSTTTRKFGGLGLGLAIVHHLVELHGGTIQADSLGEGQGATFTVTLPLMNVSSKQRNESLSSPRTPDTSPLTDVRILLVDDDADTRDLMAFTLEQSGALVTSVGLASEALQVFKQTNFDLLISDIGMPDVDGYMLIQQILAVPPKQGRILAIALTAYAGESNRQQALAAGFQQHIAKPVEPEELVKTVVTLIESSDG